MMPVSSFLDSRSPRERWLLAAMAALAVLWLGATQVWQPLQAHRAELAARITRIERALDRLQSQPEPAEAKPADPRATTLLVTEAAETFGLGISRMQPEGATLQLTLEDALFETVLLWIEALQRDYALQLVDLTLTRRSAPGVVGALLTLER